MNQKQTDITTGKQIRHLRTQSEMTNDDISCFLVFSVISRKKAAAFGFPIAAAKGNIL